VIYVAHAVITTSTNEADDNMTLIRDADVLIPRPMISVVSGDTNMACSGGW